MLCWGYCCADPVSGSEAIFEQRADANDGSEAYLHILGLGDGVVMIVYSLHMMKLLKNASHPIVCETQSHLIFRAVNCLMNLDIFSYFDFRGVGNLLFACDVVDTLCKCDQIVISANCRLSCDYCIFHQCSRMVFSYFWRTICLVFILFQERG